MSEITFYDSKGQALAYCEDGETIYAFTGKPIAYLSGANVYLFDGKHAGWFEDGWIVNGHLRHVVFTDDAHGGPATPAKQAKPAKGAKQAKQAKGATNAVPAKPARTTSWGSL